MISEAEVLSLIESQNHAYIIKDMREVLVYLDTYMSTDRMVVYRTESGDKGFVRRYKIFRLRRGALNKLKKKCFGDYRKKWISKDVYYDTLKYIEEELSKLDEGGDCET